jgi:5-methylcytosine-specific restriction endonuclease McrA
MTEKVGDEGALGEEIARLAARLNVATHRMLACIRAFDAAEGWHRQGAQSCAHWLTWRIGIDPGAAREKVRVARALGGLPQIDRVFADGRLSYAQVRAVTRIATPANEARVLDIALAATGAQLERICRGFRKATELDQAHAADRRVRARALGDGLVRLEVVLSADEADLMMRAIDEARGSFSFEVDPPATTPLPVVASDSRREPKVEAPRPSAADALVHLASSFLARGHRAAASETSGSPRGEVVIQVGPEIASADGTFSAALRDGTHVSAEALRRVACDGGVVVVASDPAGNVLDVGRRTRAIPSAIRRALLLRDTHCRFPGCANSSFLHGHHIQHWLHGGRTALENLLTLCSFHHRQVHEGGFRVSLTAEAEVEVWTPGGRRLPAVPRLEPDPGTFDWLGGEWDPRDGARPSTDGALPLPLWDGEPPDYEAAVDALLIA